jgi:outer membrane receptor protein involved in Fe transport
MARYGWSIYVGAIPTTALTQETANNGTLTFRSHNAAISDTYVITPSITNEIKYGISTMPTQGNRFDFQSQDIMGKAGLQGTDGLLGLPGINIAGFSGWSASAVGNTAYNTQTIADSLSIAHGKHFLKFGVQFNYESVNFTTATTPPTFTFDGRLSGFSWADFMLGFPASITRTVAPGPFHYIAKDWGFFAQDEIRLTRNLNLTLGLRYQIWPYSYDEADLLSVFDPGKGAVIVPNAQAKGKVVPTFPVRAIPVLTAAEANYPAQNRSLSNTDLRDWAPRIGFAWQPRKNTVLRGGYGIFFWNNRTGGPAAAGSDSGRARRAPL